MLDILNEINQTVLPPILGEDLCNGILNGCSLFAGNCSPMTNIITAIDPFSNPQSKGTGAKTTASYPSICPDGFLSFVNFATTSSIPWQKPLKGVIYPPDKTEKDTITEWLQAMNQLYDKGNTVINCLLNKLCDCKPDITMFVARGTGSLAPGFAGTLKVPQTDHFYQMYINIDKLSDPHWVKNNEWMVQIFNDIPAIDLTHNHIAADYYFLPGVAIGSLVHEFGHLLDHQYWPLYDLSHTHAYMWEAYYYLELMRMEKPSINLNGMHADWYNPPITISTDFLNLDIDFTCNDIMDKLNDATIRPR